MNSQEQIPLSNTKQHLDNTPDHEELSNRMSGDSSDIQIHPAETKESPVTKEDDQKRLAAIRRQIGLETENKATTIHETTDFEKWVGKITKQKIIGSGAEKNVYMHPDDPSKIVAVIRANGTEKSVYDLKARFYINKILSLLYPNTIPDIHLAASQPAILIIDHVMGKDISPNNPIHQFRKMLIRRRLRKLGIWIDDNNCNLMAAKNGSVFYIDGFHGDFKYHEEELLKKINRLKPQEKRAALSYLKRIEVLRKEKKQEQM